MATEQASASDEKKGPIDSVLSLFADVKPGEGLTALVLLFDVFLMLVAYYLLKTVREPLILAGGGVELKNYATAVQAVVLMGFVPLYASLTKRFPRMQLITGTLLFFAANLVLFWLLALLKVPYIGFAFFVWLGCFALCVIAQFWSLANDLYTPEQGKRLFAIIGIGSSTGAVAGSYIAKYFASKRDKSIPDSPPNVSPYVTMLIAAGILLVCLALAWVANSREHARQEAHRERTQEKKADEKAIDGKNGFALLLQDRYLLLIAGLILLLNLVNTTGETIFDITMLEQAKSTIPGYADMPEEAQEKAIGTFVGPFRADFFFWVNLVGAVTQMFLVSRIFKYLGIRIALFSLPLIGIIAYGGILLFPVLAYVRIMKIAENAVDYSLYNTTKQALWLPTSREDKYNAKMTIDSFIVRIGDLLASGASLIFLALGFGVRTYALANLVMIAVWLVVVVLLGRKNAERTAEKDAATG